MHSKAAQEKLTAASMYFGQEESDFHQAVQIGQHPKQRGELEQHTAELIWLLRKSAKELQRPAKGGTVGAPAAYRALKEVAEAVRKLCEEVHIVKKLPPSRMRTL